MKLVWSVDDTHLFKDSEPNTWFLVDEPTKRDMGYVRCDLVGARYIANKFDGPVLEFDNFDDAKAWLFGCSVITQ